MSEPQKRIAWQSRIVVFSILVLIAVGCAIPAEVSLPSSPVAAATINPSNSTDNISSAIRVFFTDPDASDANQHRGGPDEYLVAQIDAAQETLDLALYSLSLESVTDALLRASQRGVRVRLVMESESIDKEQPQRLANAGISIVGDQREGLMHNKFTVLDGNQVCTGSLNLTTSGTYSDNNNMVCFVSAEMARDYETEFEEMFNDHDFGPDSPADTPFPQVTVAGSQVQIYFSSEDGVASHLIDLLSGAEESIYFMAYSFTSNDIANAMVDRATEGVELKGVFDEARVQDNQGGEYDYLKKHIDVRLDGNDGLMHHKVIIIDRSVVITGSYNFTASAENNNDENCIVIYDRNVAEMFLQEFYKVYEQAK